MDLDSVNLDLGLLDVGQLALFVGQRLDALVLARLHALGFTGLRVSHGYLVQHLVAGDRAIGELAERMGISQQAVSKVVRELETLGYVTRARGTDGRQRIVALSREGRAALTAARRVRVELSRRAQADLTPEALQTTRQVLTTMLGALGGADAVRARRVEEPGQPA